MVLYTPLSIDDIYPAQASEQKIVSYKGKTMIIEKNVHHQQQILQLISTNPNDFLQLNLTPGTVINNDPIHDDI